MYEISATGHFSAAHRLKGYSGECASQHGHNWQVEVFIRGHALNETGILVDFKLLKQSMRDVLDRLDHKDLSDTALFRDQNPTSENIARFLYEELSAKLNGGACRVQRVEVCETPGTKASYWRD